MADNSYLSQSEWAGLNDNLTDISAPGDTEAYIVENASLLIRGECGRRLGFGAQIVDTGMVCAEIGIYVVFITSGGVIQSDLQ